MPFRDADFDIEEYELFLESNLLTSHDDKDRNKAFVE